jgi:mannose-6-phosphate isomerase
MLSGKLHMTGTRLVPRRVEKVWGRRDLAPWFSAVPDGGEPVGEIWFELPDGSDEPDLLVKFLFTSERLSVQVHPDDAAARARGLERGKNEAWYVLDAESHSSIGLGLLDAVDRELLRQSALDGSIVDLMHWRGVGPSDCFFAPAGTIHAIGAGIKLIEVQQNSDTTYRLYDYGRPRELHLEDGIAVADPRPWSPAAAPEVGVDGRSILVAGPSFVMERWHMRGSGEFIPDGGRACHLIVLAGAGFIDGRSTCAGEVWFAEGRLRIDFASGAELLIAYPGEAVVDRLWRPHDEVDGVRPALVGAVATVEGQELT